jgi:hypothetical protein
VDAIIGGVILGIGLSVMLSLTSRSLRMQADGEKRLTASWLADELLTMVIVDGPDNFPKRNDTSGRFTAPFETFGFDVDIEYLGKGLPYRVNAAVSWSDRPADAVRVETLVALRTGEPEQLREPHEPVDRMARYYDDE